MAKKNNSFAAGLIGIVKEGTKKWTRTVQMEERNPSSRRYRSARMTRERGIKFKEAAEEVMEEAYNKASGNGRYTALARQIMYAARPYIQQKTGKPLQSAYFTQYLLPNYIEEYGCHHWRTGYDARGHMIEPHGGKIINLGTTEVRGYLKGIHDPRHVEAKLAAADIEFYGFARSNLLAKFASRSSGPKPSFSMNSSAPKLPFIPHRPTLAPPCATCLWST